MSNTKNYLAMHKKWFLENFDKFIEVEKQIYQNRFGDKEETSHISTPTHPNLT